MKRISQLIAASAKELTNGKRYPSRALVLNETTGELRRGPGTWDEMPRYKVDVPVDVEAVTVATTNVADGGLAVGQTVNGKVLAAGDVVLRVAQNAGAENGLFVVPSGGGSLERHPDYDTISKLAGTVVKITEGDKADILYLCTNDRTGTIGTTTVVLIESVGGTFLTKAPSITGTTLFQLYNQDGTSKMVDASTMKTFFTT